MAILGDMFEIGEDTMLEHQRIVDQVNSIGLDRAYLIGEAFFDTTGVNDTVNKFKTFVC